VAALAFIRRALLRSLEVFMLAELVVAAKLAATRTLPPPAAVLKFSAALFAAVTLASLAYSALTEARRQRRRVLCRVRVL